MDWLLKLLSFLPLRALQLFGAGVGELTFRLSSTLKNRTRENLVHAGYTDDKLYERVGRNSGRQAMESIWVWYRPAETVLKRVTVASGARELIERAVASGRPIVFLTPHIGCFEVLPVWFADTFFKKTGRKICILFRPPRNALLRKIVGDARQAPGIDACPTTIVGVKRVIRNLRDGHTFGALPDQVPSRGEGLWIDFFGRQAYTMTLPVRVAAQFDAIRIIAWGARSGHGWTLDAVEWDEPLTGDLETDVAGMNRQIEQVIRRMPEQYAWSYNRYKTVSGAKPKKTENN